MGNSQSTDQDSGDSGISMYDPSRDLSDLVIPIPVGGYRSTPELRNHLHNKIFGSTDVREVGSQESLGGSLRPSPSPRHQSASPTALKKLLRLEGGKGIDVASLSLILKELKDTASPEELSMLRTILSPTGTSETSPAQDDLGRDFKAFEYRGHVVRQASYYGPSPGHATRSKIQKLRKQPTQKSSRGSENHKAKTWSPEDFTASPLSHIASLKSPGAEGPAITPPRPTTPSDIECVNLGGLRPGTLRVTNGIATPEPSILSGFTPAMPQPSPGAPDDYFTCSEGTDDGGASPGRNVGEDGDPHSSLQASPTTPTLLPRLHTPGLSKRPEQHMAVSPIGSRKAVQQHERSSTSPLPEPKPFALYSQEASSNPFLADLDEPLEDSSIQNSSPIMVPTENRLQMPHEPDCESIYSDPAQALSPSTSVKRQDNLHRTFNRLTGVLEEDTSKDLPSSSPCQKDSAVDMSAAFEVNPKSLTPHENAHQISESSCFASNRSSLRRKPIGDHSRQGSAGQRYYATQASDVPAPDDPFGIRYDDLPEDATPKLPRLGSFSPVASHASRQIQSSPLEALSPLSPPNPSYAAAPNFSLKSRSATDLLETLPSSPVVTSDGTTSLPASAEKSKKTKKLQKKRFSKLNLNSKEPVVVQTQTVPQLHDLPSIPVHVAANYSKRMSEFPGMEHLEHTFDSVSVVGVRTESPERTVELPEIRFPSPSHDDNGSPLSDRGRRARRGSTGPGASPSKLLQALTLRSSSGNRKVSDPQEVVDGELMGVQDFGTVARLAGSSPYEIASKAAGRPLSANMTKLSKRKAPETSTKTTVGMDDKTASQLARRRSRDLAVNKCDVFDGSMGKSPDAVQYERPARPPMRPLASDSVIPPVPTTLNKPHKGRPQSYAGPPTTQRPMNKGPSGAVGVPQEFSDAPPAGPQGRSPLRKEVAQAWQAQAAFWQRRREEDAEADVRHDATEAAPAQERPTALEAPATATARRAAPPPASPPKFDLPRAGARSPSPSIKERAAFFEHAAAAQAGSSPRAPARAPARLQTAAALLSSYDTSGPAAPAEPRASSPARLAHIMSGADDVESARRARPAGDGDPQKQPRAHAGKENEHASPPGRSARRLSDMRGALRAIS